MRTWKIGLKDNRSVLIRPLSADDKQRLLSFVNALSEEAILWGNPSYDEAKIDRWMSGAGKGLSLVAIDGDRIVGIAGIHVPSLPRVRGIGDMMIYLHQDFHGVGLGTAMTERLLALAKDKGLHRIGLEVVEDNEAAVRLYKRLGFKVEGTLRDAYYGTDKKYHNMFVMGRLFRLQSVEQ